ncbi:MAG: hypothetical protein G01um101477_592 [Candidatus Doudnabacteria bacterium Gr01-1014_77]|uniref:Uncharacterized protein n=1 Tax=Candidatus Doudnabacteria bacterium Gr01-1014_77 TaxID=2017133 RepID=A0A554JA16_9BACT|nr:MAG: hypothetical protein G01um101477_592 [Candidatus Doudnabacteria bacterium Gr01-1014_77]
MRRATPRSPKAPMHPHDIAASHAHTLCVRTMRAIARGKKRPSTVGVLQLYDLIVYFWCEDRKARKLPFLDVRVLDSPL